MVERCPGCGHNFYHDQPVRDGLCKYCIEDQEVSEKHKTELDGGLKKLAMEVTSLRYDALQKFLEEMSRNLLSDSVADEARGRPKLAAALSRAAGEIAQAWEICRKHMQDEVAGS